jgi:hypothetical protein
MRYSRPLLLAALVLAAAACSSRPEGSGFLGGPEVYESLQPSEYDSDVLVWRNPRAQPAAYDSFLVEPVRVVLSPEARASAPDPVDMERLAEHFRKSIATALGEGYAVVEKPGSSVMTVRAALTGVSRNIRALNVLPTKLLFGFGVGGATMEAEFLDSETGERLAVVMADSKGKRYKYEQGLSTWGHTEEVLEYWAALMKKRMDAVRGEQ